MTRISRRSVIAGIASEGAPNQVDAEVKALRGLEPLVGDLDHMAWIMSELLDELLTPTEQEASDSLTIRLSKHELETLSFAWNDVCRRSKALRNAFYAAVYKDNQQ